MDHLETEYQEQIIQLMKDKRTDQLTGLGNYCAFREYVHNLSSMGCVFSVVLFDATNLKAANEELGHFGADALLHKIGQKIRDYDAAFRYGGDEYAVVLPSCSLGEAKAVRDRVEMAVGVRWLSSGHPVTLVGECAQIRSDVDLDRQLNRCDNLLEKRKISTKNELVFALQNRKQHLEPKEMHLEPRGHFSTK